MTSAARRRCFMLLTLFCLLFQQVATAAYACTILQATPAPIAMLDCASAGMAPIDMAPAAIAPEGLAPHGLPSGHASSMDAQAAHEAAALCDRHCAPEQSVAPDHAP
ncbi:MAG: hypothetical protein M3Q40_05440, partial [Pseudomonadota bacterium]|nr:hypothetical protein [Pseudomonadota bacterium]